MSDYVKRHGPLIYSILALGLRWTCWIPTGPFASEQAMVLPVPFSERVVGDCCYPDILFWRAMELLVGRPGWPSAC